MKQTSNSSNIMNILIATLTTVIVVPAIALIPNMMKIIQAKDMAIACPAIIFAKSRIIRAKGLVNILKNSMNGINGTGTFSHVGTSGQKMSFQYAFVPVTLVTMNVHNAKKSVIVMLPVRLPPPGGNGTTPMTFARKMKKKHVNKYGAYLSASFPNDAFTTSF